MKSSFNMPTVDLDKWAADEKAKDPGAAAGNSYPFLQPPMEKDELGWILHYKVLRKLGEGGMGMVFVAEDTHLRRPVALKVMLPAISQDVAARERFLREARAMAALTHDHVITVYQVGTAPTPQGGEISFLAMQFLEGGTLEDVLLERGRLPVGEAARICVEAAQGLAAAHARGMIHRDIKPANIYLEAPRGRVKILDFGLARVMDQSAKLSASGQVIGTPYFMAPEQAAGAAIDARADLFSLGCVLYTSLSGELPFDGESLMAVLTKLAISDPLPLAGRFPEVPAELSNLVQRLMSKKPDDRPANADELVTLLAPFAGTQGLSIRSHFNTALDPQAQVKTDTLPGALGNTAPSMNKTPAPSAGTASDDMHDRRRFILGAGIAAAGGLGYLLYRNRRQSGGPATSNSGVVPPSGEPIVVGILHSQTGTLRNSAVPVMQMTETALEQLNVQGGLLGRPVKFINRNAASDEQTAAREAKNLIEREKVQAIFGCWTSSARKAVKAVVEMHNNLLLYPVQYEGLEESPNIVYTGATPNQQILPAVDWFLRTKPQGTFFLVGSDYIFPRCANEVIKHRLEKKGHVVGEEYVALGGLDFKAVCQKIADAEPDYILNTLNGSSNEAFFTQLRAQGIHSGETPTISFSVDEQILRGMPPRLVAGDYAAWNYFESIAGPRNADFVKLYRDVWGTADAVTDAMEAAYISVRLWAQAVTLAGTSDPAAVRESILGQKMDAPEGEGVQIDPENRHTWKYFRLGQITPEGTFNIVHEHDSLTPPVPYPRFRTVPEWEKFQADLYRGWGNRWSRE